MLETLSPREREIFDLLLEGVSPKEIAHRLNITVHTVAFHRTKLYNKLGVQSIQELFAKYSTNGKEAPSEAPESPESNTIKTFFGIPVSGTNNQTKRKFLLPVIIIPVNNLVFHPKSDEEFGGNSTSEVFITREEIDGVSIDVLNLKTNLAKKTENSKHNYAGMHTNSYYVINQLRRANGIRFKARGDGKSWNAGFHTTEATAETNYAHYKYEFGTVRDQVIVIDVPYSSLFLPEYYNLSFDFKKETITLLTIETNHSVQNYGSSFLQIFDFEIY